MGKMGNGPINDTYQPLNTGDSPTFAGITVSGATATRLLATDGSKGLASVANLASWIAGTANRVTVTDDGDGTITLSGPQDLHTAASPQFAGLTLTGTITLNNNIAVQMKDSGGTARNQFFLGTDNTMYYDGGAGGTKFRTAYGVLTYLSVNNTTGALTQQVGATTGGVTITKGEATATLSGASTVIQVNVPTGAKILGCQLQVETTITSGDGAATWAAAYSGGATQAITTGQAFTQNVEVSTHFNVNAATNIASSEVDVTITPNAGTFSGGVIRAIVFYETFTAMADAS